MKTTITWGSNVLFLFCGVLAAQINFTVSGTVPNLQQPTPNVCWATAATMMISWKNDSNLSIQTVMTQADNNSGNAFGFAQMFASDQGLSGGIKPSFLQALRFKAEPPMNPSVTGWRDLMQANGPLWVTTNEGTQQNFAIHARVMIGIAGDGTADGTFLSFIDPADGMMHSESVTTFVQKFEEVARQDLGDGADLRPQIVHL